VGCPVAFGLPGVCGSVGWRAVVGFRPGAACVRSGCCPVWCACCCRGFAACGAFRLWGWCVGGLVPVFPSRVLARAWAVACGVPVALAGAAVVGRPGAWSSVSGPPVQVSCLFCSRLGGCAPLAPGPGCGFRPSRHWPVSVVQQPLF